MNATFALALAYPASVDAESIQFFDDPEPIAFTVDPVSGMPSFAKDGDYEGGKLGLLPEMAYVPPETRGCGTSRKSALDFVEARTCPDTVPFGGLRMAGAYTDLPRTGTAPASRGFGSPFIPPVGGSSNPEDMPQGKTFGSTVPEQVAPVPLPASWLMLVAALSGYPLLKRRRAGA